MGENNEPAGWSGNTPTMTISVALQKGMSVGLAVSSSCEALHINHNHNHICDSYIDKSLKEGERVRRSSNIAPGELSIPEESTMHVEKCWVSSEKKNWLLLLIQKIMVDHKFLLPSTVQSRQS